MSKRRQTKQEIMQQSLTRGREVMLARRAESMRREEVFCAMCGWWGSVDECDEILELYSCPDCEAWVRTLSDAETEA